MALMLRRCLPVVRTTLCRSNKTSSQATSSVPDVKGLSSNVVDIPKEPVGPGASKSTQYKNPEYFCYNNTSYFEAEVEMNKFRLPQPSNKKK